MENNTQNRLIEVLKKTFELNEIVWDPSLTAEEVDGWDSITHLDLIVNTEEEFKIEISGIANIPKFELSTIDHFTKLILFKSQHWKIRCKATHLKEKIEILFRKHKLDQLMQRTAFEPIIKGKTSAETYHIHTIFSLNFEENTKTSHVLAIPLENSEPYLFDAA